MKNPVEQQNRELTEMVKGLMDGATNELATMLPNFDLSAPVSDKKIKQAILDLNPGGMGNLIQQFGQKEVMDFINDFSRGKKW